MTEETFISDGKLEAKVVSTTQNDKGWYIRLLLHPSDTDEVTKLRYGAVLDIRWRELIDVEVHKIECEAEVARKPTDASRGVENVAGARPAGHTLKHKERFEDMPLVKQCVLRCQDGRFQLYLRSHFATVWGVSDFGAVAPHVVAARVVRTICNVVSRAELGTDEKSAKEWRTLEDGYEQWATDQKYAGLRR